MPENEERWRRNQEQWRRQKRIDRIEHVVIAALALAFATLTVAVVLHLVP